MKNKYITGSLIAVFVVLVAACSPYAVPTSAPAAVAPMPATVAPTMPPVSNSPTMPAVSILPTQSPVAPYGKQGQSSAVQPVGQTIMVAKDSKLGSILVDSKGMTLYLFLKDTPNTPTCYGTCATLWPALITTGKPMAGTGVDAAKLGTVKRTDGSMQVTYFGWPLYYYASDANPGDTMGQGIANIWYVVSPMGTAMK